MIISKRDIIIKLGVHKYQVYMTDPVNIVVDVDNNDVIGFKNKKISGVTSLMFKLELRPNVKNGTNHLGCLDNTRKKSLGHQNFVNFENFEIFHMAAIRHRIWKELYKSLKKIFHLDYVNDDATV